MLVSYFYDLAEGFVTDRVETLSDHAVGYMGGAEPLIEASHLVAFDETDSDELADLTRAAERLLGPNVVGVIAHPSRVYPTYGTVHDARRGGDFRWDLRRVLFTGKV